MQSLSYLPRILIRTCMILKNNEEFLRILIISCHFIVCKAYTVYKCNKNPVCHTKVSPYVGGTAISLTTSSPSLNVGYVMWYETSPCFVRLFSLLKFSLKCSMARIVLWNEHDKYNYYIDTGMKASSVIQLIALISEGEGSSGFICKILKTYLNTFFQV